MIKRTVEISQQPAHVTVQLDQLLIKRDGQTVGSIPCEDIGMLLVDHAGSTYSHAALAALMNFDATVVVCGRNHLPAGILLPLSDHSQVVWRIRDQVKVAKPLRKQLWRQIVQAKIRAQAENLPEDSVARRRMTQMIGEVRSGDTSNVEAQAARLYWSHWLGTVPFRRDSDGDGLNGLLNYGYAVVRAAIARTLVSSGLLPAIGLHHSNRSNAFCLADDLIEPLRPLVDRRVREIYERGESELCPTSKKALLELLAERVQTGEQTGPLLVALHFMTASLVRCFEGTARELELPRAC